jgi:hypothetical protein
MTKTLIILFVAGVAVLLVGGVAWAKHRGYCGGTERIIERATRELALNPEQKGKLETLGRTLTGIREQWRQRRGEVKGQVLDLLSTPTLDRDKAASLLEQRHEVWRERGDLLLAQFADFSDSLDDGQRQKLRAWIEKRTRHRWFGPAASH